VALSYHLLIQIRGNADLENKQAVRDFQWRKLIAPKVTSVPLAAKHFISRSALSPRPRSIPNESVRRRVAFFHLARDFRCRLEQRRTIGAQLID